MRGEAESPVSVVIPCYNQARYLPEAIESALTQTAGRPEVIVVNDGSTEPVDLVVARYPGVHLIVQPNSGVAAARNTGLCMASRPLVIFLDADDRLTPEAVATGLAVLESRPEAAGAIGLCRVIDPEGRPRPFRQQPPIAGEPYAALLRSNFVWMPAEGIYRREALLRIGGFDPSNPAAADYDLYLRLAREYALAVHRNVVAEYRVHDANMSANGLLMLRSTLCVLERQWPYARQRPEHRAAYAEGNRFWRDFYGDRVVEEIRASLKTAGRRRRAVRWALALLRHHPRAVAVQLFRKLRNSVRRLVNPVSAG
ncbi:MAG TPA: glycosyltransferase [Vicinamibacterales bacterium]|nr:glycosyltransferase [Acidobacteriota bacterium]HOC18381.1 glycosyltransferase [Vicinamibacterales bacterium]